MISIFSTSEGELTTCKVIDWLDTLGADFQRINLDNIESFKDIEINISNASTDLKLCESEGQIQISNKGVSWFRRGNIAAEREPMNSSIEGVAEYRYLELDRIIDFVFKKFKNDYWLNHPEKAIINKLETLNIARKHFVIPETLIANSKEAIFNFLKQHEAIIVKPISEGKEIKFEEEVYWQYTETIEEDFLHQMSNTVFPSLVQKAIDKEFEIRSFYLDGEVYSMAIFSQKDKHTQKDFRHYNQKSPNRMVPYKLNQEEHIAIKNFMIEMDLNCGIIDLIKSKNGEIVFLEVNPVGQFGMISSNCNYNLEKKVAEFLMNKEKLNEKS